MRVRVMTAVVLAAALTTGCIAVSRELRHTPVVLPSAGEGWELDQDWSCDATEHFNLVHQRAVFDDEMAAWTEAGWEMIDFDVVVLEGRTCLVGTYRRYVGD